MKGTLTFDEKIVEKLKKARRPITKKDLRSFVSLCGFYQKFIKNFNTKAAPLTDLTMKGEQEKNGVDSRVRVSLLHVERKADGEAITTSV